MKRITNLTFPHPSHPAPVAVSPVRLAVTPQLVALSVIPSRPAIHDGQLRRDDTPRELPAVRRLWIVKEGDDGDAD